MSISSFEISSRSETSAPNPLSLEFDYPQRRGNLVRRLQHAAGSNMVALICDPDDIMYLSGVREGISWLAVWEGGGFAVTRHMLIREVTELVGDFELLLPTKRSTDPVELEAFVISELAGRGFARAAVSPERMNAASYLRLERGASEGGLEVVVVGRLVESLRQCKDAAERRAIGRCVAIAEQALVEMLGKGASGLVGRSELELARELDSRMIGLGADRQGFPGTGVIVASGPNSASAHHAPSRRMVEAGDPLLIDWGAEVDGYRSDMTRTLFVDTVPEFARAGYPVVAAALAAAGDALCVGAEMGEIDRIAREIVTGAGYPEFHYGVGHGVGLAIHEGPWLRAHSEDRLEAGMITTVEPGIYLPGVGGIRIESMYALSDRGSERLDRLPVSLDHMVIG